MKLLLPLIAILILTACVPPQSTQNDNPRNVPNFAPPPIREGYIPPPKRTEQPESQGADSAQSAPTPPQNVQPCRELPLAATLMGNDGKPATLQRDWKIPDYNPDGTWSVRIVAACAHIALRDCREWDGAHPERVCTFEEAKDFAYNSPYYTEWR